MLLLFIFITCSQLLLPTTCPPMRDFNCGLAGQKKPENSRRHEMIKYKDFRRRVTVNPWILDPREIKELAPTSTTARIYYDLTAERCDYMRIRCMNSYLTGAICARTIYYQYVSFTSYCAMVFHNCISKYDNVWSIAYMGYCTEPDMDKDLYVEMTYDQMTNNSRMQSMYIFDSGDITAFQGYAYVATMGTKDTKSTISSTRNIIYHNVTDKDGNLVTDDDGNGVTVTEIVTVPYRNVTDDQGKLMTDDEGDYITITEPITTTTTTEAPETTTLEKSG